VGCWVGIQLYGSCLACIAKPFGYIRECLVIRLSSCDVICVTGVLKSTFIKHATGLDVEVWHSQNACESYRASVLT
jgi:hypothetical protein